MLIILSEKKVCIFPFVNSEKKAGK